MEQHKTIVTDIKIPFFSMVILLVKLAMAAIPALIILTVAGVALSGVAVALFHKLPSDAPFRSLGDGQSQSQTLEPGASRGPTGAMDDGDLRQR